MPLNIYLRGVPSDPDRDDVRLYDPTQPDPPVAGGFVPSRMLATLGIVLAAWSADPLPQQTRPRVVADTAPPPVADAVPYSRQLGAVAQSWQDAQATPQQARRAPPIGAVDPLRRPAQSHIAASWNEIGIAVQAGRRVVPSAAQPPMSPRARLAAAVGTWAAEALPIQRARTFPHGVAAASEPPGRRPSVLASLAWWGDTASPQRGRPIAAVWFPNQYFGWRLHKSDGTNIDLCLVAVADRNVGMNGTPMERKIDGITYAAYVVDTTDPFASPVRIADATGVVRSIRLKT